MGTGQQGLRVMCKGRCTILLLLTVPVVFRIPATQGRAQLAREWTINLSAIFPGVYPGPGHQSPPTVWDIDGDGQNEMLFGTRGYSSKPVSMCRFWCFGQEGKLKWLYPSLDKDPLPGHPLTKASLLDVDGDGVLEIATGGRGGRLSILRPDGTLLWLWEDPNGSSMLGAPNAYDVDGDGLLELFVNAAPGSSSGPGFLHRIDHEGKLVWTFQQGVRGVSEGQGPPTIADVDQDGEFEVLWASEDGNVYCISAASASRKWRYGAGSKFLGTNCVIVADFNKDGEYEAITWMDAPAQCVLCLNSHGTELWRWRVPGGEGNIRLCQALGDVDEDGSMDMAVMSSGGIFVVDIGGPQPVTKWAANLTAWSKEGKFGGAIAKAWAWSAYQLIADLDGDDRLEILWMAPFPIVTDGATGELEAYLYEPNMMGNTRAENGAWWGDFDSDGVSEWMCIVKGNWGYDDMVYCLTMNGKFPAKSPWPEYCHSAYPAQHQAEQGWLTLKSAYSNSLWFPIGDGCTDGVLPAWAICVACILVVGDALCCLAAETVYEESRMPWPKILRSLIKQPAVSAG